MTLESTLHNFLSSYPNSHFIVAYSGGVDSQVLLHALSNIKKTSTNNCSDFANNISVCHVNHGLSDNAEQWERFAQQQCNLYQVDVDICRVQVKVNSQDSLEEMARNARYAAIKSLISSKQLSNVVVLTGHHNDDQAETFLLALKRGAGVKGLSAMKKVMAFDNALLARPLLNVTRNEIEAYALANKLSWVDDESNEDVRFDRNFIRHHVMPEITQRWPSFLKTINRSAEHCQEADLLLTELAQQDLQLILTADKTLSLSKLKTLSPSRFNNAIRHFLSSHDCLMPSRAQLSQLQQQLLAKTDKAPAVKVGEHWLRRYKDNVYLTEELIDISDVVISINKDLLQSSSEYTIELPDGISPLMVNLNHSPIIDGVNTEEIFQVIAPTETQQVSVRFTHTNPKCTPDYRQHSRSLKKILQELDIPTWERKRLPFLYYNEELIAVIGYFVCKNSLPAESDEYLSILQLK